MVNLAGLAMSDVIPTTFKNRLQSGIAEIDAERHYLIGMLSKTLENLGEKECARMVDRIEEGWTGPIPSKGSQALSIYFQMVNLVEEGTANAKSKQWRTQSGSPPDSGTCLYYLQRMRESGVSAEEARRSMESAFVETVFTKHPTESKRGSILRLHRRLYRIVRDNRIQIVDGNSNEAIDSAVEILLEQIWRSGEIYTSKPSVEDENRNLFYYLKEILPNALGPLRKRFQKAWQDAYPESAPSGLPTLRFGSWVGGDRDGHPLVTSEVTLQTLEALRRLARGILDGALDTLESNLTFNTYAHGVPENLAGFLKTAGVDSSSVEEPWREFVSIMRRRLMDTNDSKFYARTDQLEDDLLVLRKALLEVRGERLIERYLQPVEDVLHTFGFHCARLDIRQNSAYLSKAFGQMLHAAGIEDGMNYEFWDEDRKVAFLDRELQSSRPFTSAWTNLGDEAKEILNAFRVANETLENHGAAGLGCIIVSMTRAVSDLLVIYAIAREAGLARMNGGGLASRLPVAPLFETMDDLQRSSSIMKRFLEHPVTRQTLKTLGSDERVEPAVVMLGYSDSNKDCGIWASQWTLYNTQNQLVALSKELKQPMRFFHGRGGTVGRGAGPIHRFLEGMPNDALKAGLRLTEQGEVIGQNYNTVESAVNNLELLVAGGACARMMPTHPDLIGESSAGLALVAESSQKAYRSLISQDRFIEFYRAATPIDVIEQSNIGSRPSRRTGMKGLEDLRAIPWVFSWNQSRFYLPGWFGVGTGLKDLKKDRPDAFSTLQKVWKDWPFLRYLLFNIETSLASVSTKIIQDYAELVEEAILRDRFMQAIESELELTKNMVGQLLNREIGKGRPRLAYTLQLRDSGLKILHDEQIRLLRRWRACDANTSEWNSLLSELLMNVNAVASGLRTTG